MVKSLHTIHSLDNRLGGAVHAGLNVCKYLVESGNPVEVFSTQGVHDDLAYLSDLYRQIPVHLTPRRFPQRWYNGHRLREWLMNHLAGFDMVELHAVFSFVTLQTAHACRRLGKPYLLRPHGSLDPFDLSKRGTLKRLLGPLFLRPVIAGAAGVMCTSQREADLVETYGASVRRFLLPLPEPKLETDSAAGVRFRERHRIPADAPVVLFLSRIDYKKGLEFLLPALAHARRATPNLHFILAGGGQPDFVEQILRLLGELQLTGCTRQVGFLSGSEKAAAFQASNLFALPSLNENFGIVLIEAMQSGLPVLVSDQVYIHPEIIEAGAGGLCKPNADDCSIVLNRMLLDRSKLFEMGHRARCLAQSRFSPEAATQGLVEIYKKIIGGGRAGT